MFPVQYDECLIQTFQETADMQSLTFRHSDLESLPVGNNKLSQMHVFHVIQTLVAVQKSIYRSYFIFNAHGTLLKTCRSTSATKHGAVQTVCIHTYM